MLPLKIMNKNEVMSDLLKLLDLVQKHADKEDIPERDLNWCK
jgi:hypothetical protein